MFRLAPSRRSLLAGAAAGAALAGLPRAARADAMDDLIAWLDEIGVKHGGQSFSRDTLIRATYLDLGRAQAAKYRPEGLRHLAAMPALRGVALTSKTFDDASAPELAKFERFTSVSINGARMTDKGLAVLAGMPNLETLFADGGLSEPSAYTAEGMKPLAAMAKLSQLSLSHSAIGDAGLAVLKAAPRLRIFTLIGAKNIGAPGLAALAAAPPLRILNLQWVEVNEEVEALAASTTLEDVTFMGAFNSKKVLDDAGAVHLAKIKSLTKAVVWHTRVTNKTAAALATLPRLRTLICNKTAIGDDGFKAFAAHAEIATIWAGETATTDAAAPAFAAMPKLNWLTLDNTKLTDAGLAKIAESRSLGSLSVRDTAVTDAGVAKAKEINAKLRVSK